MAELRATPQSPALGKIAAALRKAQEFAGQYQVLPQVPLLGGTGVDELLGLPGAAREVENWSYGNYPMRINPNAGRTASYIPEVKPGRKSDLADTLFLGMDVAPLASIARRGVTAAARTPAAQAIDRAVREGYERGVIPAPGMTIKPKGGNWLSGHVEYATEPLKRMNNPVISGDIINEAAGRDLFSEYVNVNARTPTMGLQEWTRKNHPEVYAQIQAPEERAANRWIDTKLSKYIRNEMATPEDPVRALAERGVLHVDPQQLNYRLSEYGKHRQPGQEFLAESEAAKLWEGVTDNAIGVGDAGTQAEFGRSIEKNPWLTKVPPETKVYGTIEGENLASDLGFDHLIDELKFAMHPNSGLPDNLRFDPKDIDKITVPQAVERVSKINAWRAEQAAKAEREGMMTNLQATPRLPDEELQLSFVDKPGGAWVDIPETIDENGMRICNSIGKAGGWCTQDKWAAESYGSGENRLAALVDAEGRPHAQAKITSDSYRGDLDAFDESLAKLTPEQEADFQAFQMQLDNPLEMDEALTWLQDNAPQAFDEFKRLSVQKVTTPDITELKPPGNSFDSARAKEYIKRDPQYKQKVTESVLKFLNNGNWGYVKDLHHYDIVDMNSSGSVMDALQALYGDESGRRVGQQFIDGFNMAVQAEPNANRFMTTRQLREFIGPIEPLEGYGAGGIVKSLGKMVQKYLAKEGAEAAAETPVKEQKMLMGVYRGYAGERGDPTEVFATPQKSIADYYARRRAAETGGEPHAEMLLVDPFVGQQYGLSIPLDKYNRDINFTKARKLKPEDVRDRTPLYARGGMVDYDRDEIAQIAERAVAGYAAGGLVNYDPNEIDTIVSQLKEEFHG